MSVTDWFARPIVNVMDVLVLANTRADLTALEGLQLDRIEN